MSLLVSLDHPCGWGVLKEDGVVESRHILGGAYGSLRELLGDGGGDAAVDDANLRPADAPQAAYSFLPTIPDPAHIFCCGLNYAAHAEETGKAPPPEPRIFARTASSLIGHGEALQRPRVSEDFDFEGEIAIIIGTPGRYIPESAAMDHVGGYTCFMDGSLRDRQKITTTLGKNFEGTGALGPGMVLAREVPDWRALELRTKVNGAVMQKGCAAQMIYSMPRVIAFLSEMVTLQPGDVIATGTPEGIGCRRDPPVWLAPGDVVEVDVPAIGCLRNTVVQG